MNPLILSILNFPLHNYCHYNCILLVFPVKTNLDFMTKVNIHELFFFSFC